MAYNYDIERPRIFSEEGQVMFLRIRDNASRLIGIAGAARAQEILADVIGDTWMMLACLDRLVELRELREIQQLERVAGQHRIFVQP